MTKKKKVSKEEQKERRLKEAAKAQGRTGIAKPVVSDNKEASISRVRVTPTNLNKSGTLDGSSTSYEAEGVHILPVKAIKKDLIKILFFMGFSTIFLLFLRWKNIDISFISGFISSFQRQ